MKSFTLALIATRAAAIQVASDYDNTWEHSHIEYSETDKFRDVEIFYDEIEYTISTVTD